MEFNLKLMFFVCFRLCVSICSVSKSKRKPAKVSFASTINHEY